MTKFRSVYRTYLMSAIAIGTGIGDAAASAPPAYHVTDLGTLGEGTYSYGIGINASGQVSGYSYTTGDATADGAFHAFLYDGTLHDLGTLGGSSSNGYGINNSGHVSGYAQTTGDAALHAFLYDGAMHDLGTLGGTSSYGLGINNSGQVAGYSYTTESDYYSIHAFLYDGTLHDLGTLGGTWSQGFGINENGQVTGISNTIGGTDNAFLWTPATPGGTGGTMHDLGTLGGTSSFGWGVNDSGHVSGYSLTTEDAETHAFLYDGTLHDLGTLGGTISEALGINAGGQVTGGSQTTGDAAYHAFLYTSGSGMVDLNALTDPLSGWELQFGTGINDAGQITGSGLIGGEQHAFLLTPVPEPASLALLALGLPLLVWRNSRRSGSGGTRSALGPMTFGLHRSP